MFGQFVRVQRLRMVALLKTFDRNQRGIERACTLTMQQCRPVRSYVVLPNLPVGHMSWFPTELFSMSEKTPMRSQMDMLYSFESSMGNTCCA